MQSLYLSKYPRSGQRAILCEGDLAGYEADLLEQWTATSPELGLVDVWPCGTKSAIYGLSDAIGRAIPVFVIEDRDHRSVQKAEKDCKQHQKDRLRRGVKMIGWKAWDRSEIENYLTDPVVLFSVMAQVFQTTEDVVADRLQTVLSRTACDQALQMTLSEFRSGFPKGEQDVGGVSRELGRPKWRPEGLVTPSMENVQQLFVDLMEKSVQKLSHEKHPKINSFVDMFQSRCNDWSNVKVDDEVWRTLWAGKEVLSWLRITLSGEFGWPANQDPSERTVVQWASLNATEFGDWDRRIERAIQPRLVKKFLNCLRKEKSLSANVTKEWYGLLESLKTAAIESDEPRTFSPPENRL